MANATKKAKTQREKTIFGKINTIHKKCKGKYIGFNVVLQARSRANVCRKFTSCAFTASAFFVLFVSGVRLDYALL